MDAGRQGIVESAYDLAAMADKHKAAIKKLESSEAGAEQVRISVVLNADPSFEMQNPSF